MQDNKAPKKNFISFQMDPGFLNRPVKKKKASSV